ncbi:AEC family transporter [Mailhella massiliensis]|jgi:malate permease and related proteins|uniref:AEC family transporter n=1 Tax=Mailhella massiliensis TaxID=1903261 RepID=UPI00097DCDB4|nr:AEC family transporter [Mailhella massiliensis]
MTISLLLGEQIAAMLLMVLMGYAVVRLGLLRAEQSAPLAAVALYIVGPCMMLDAFQVEFSQDKLHGLFLSLAAAALAQALAIALNALIRRPLRLDPVEQASAIYSNGGNLIIPIVIHVLGPQWVLYTSGFLIGQTALFWTHCYTLLKKNGQVHLRNILFNVNILAMAAGALLFVTGLHFPEIPRLAVHATGSMIGPLCMIVTGMLIGSVSFRRILAYRKLPLIVALRLVVFPLVTLLLFRAGGLSSWVKDGDTILLISFLAAAAPCASTVTQMSHLYGHNGEYASLINVVSTLLCVITMPVMVYLFQI